MCLDIQLACAVEPLIGRHHGVMHPSPHHGGVVSLWIQTRRDGRIQVDAVLPIDGYRVLLKRHFDEPGTAIAFWRGAHLDLFGFEA